MPEAPLTPAAVYAAQPHVTVDGREPEMLRDLLQAVALRESEGGLAALELRLAATATETGSGLGLSIAEGAVIDLGQELRLEMGPENDRTPMFTGRVSAMELLVEEGDQPQLVVQAEDALMRERRRRFSRLHPAGRLRDILGAVATETGLDPVIRGLDQRVAAQVQLNESNLAFLRRLLADHDADLRVVGNELRIAPRGEIREDSVSLRLGSQLHRVSITADLADQVSRVTLSGFDVAGGRPVTATSGAGAALGPGRPGRSGAQLLAEARSGGAEHVGGRQVHDQAEAQAIANAAFARLARRFVTLEAVASGNPRIRVGTHLTVEGAGRRFSNTYYVTSTLHRYDTAEGYVTELTAECAWLGS
jgi:phage protein D